MASGLITRFLGEGLAASRPADPDVGSAIAFYWSTDTNEMSAWLENAWVEDVFGTGGALLAANNLSDLVSAATARTNLGLGSLATLSNLDLNDLGDVDTTGVADGDVLTYDSGAGDWVAAAPGGGGAWTLHGSHTTTAAETSHAFTGLAGATDIMLVVRNLAQSVSGAAIAHVSVDNGATYFSASGDYIYFPVNSGVEANTTGLGFWTTNSTGARGGVVIIHAANVTGAPRLCQCFNDSTNRERFFVADTANDIDAVRVSPNAGSWSAGGLIYCFKR